MLSTVDYHLIRSITTPSPQTLDISPDNTAIAVGNGFSTVAFYSTTTYTQTAQFVLPQMGLGILGLVYTANGDLMVVGWDSNDNGITAYWSHAANSITYYSGPTNSPKGPYLQSSAPFPAQLTRSADYTRIMVALTDLGEVQIIDGTTGKPLYTWTQSDWSTTYVASASGGNRYAICAGPVTYTPSLYILDSNFNQVYAGPQYTTTICYGMTFSPDGNTLYGDASANGTYSTAMMNMTTFQTASVPNYFTANPLNENAGDWQAADGTGMLYGIYDQDSSGQPVWVALDTTQTLAPTPPVNPAYLPIKLVRVLDSIGSPQGGDPIDLLCQGLNNMSQSQVQVTIGGQSAQVTSISNITEGTPSATSHPAFQRVSVTSPPGSPGFVDVTLSASGTVSTASSSFEYAQSRTIYPFATTPSFLLYDPFRTLLYAAHTDHVEVIDPIGQKVLSPLVLASGKLANSNFAGIAMSPDGTRLWVADAGANLIHMISLSAPGTGYSINPAIALASSTAVSPLRVFELSNGKLLGSDGYLFQIDPGTLSGNRVLDANRNPLPGYVWNTTNAGGNALVTMTTGGDGIWNVNTGLNTQVDLSTTEFMGSAESQVGFFEAAANEDGTVIGGPGGTPIFGSPGPLDAFQDFDLNVHGRLWETAADPVANSTGLLLHPSGALYYQVGTYYRNQAVNYNRGVVDIADVNGWQPAITITLPESLPSIFGLSLNQMYSQHSLAIDPTGQYVFASTASGITQMVLSNVPLSIGNVQPPFVLAPASQALTIRGSGFQPGATVSFGGVAAATTYLDANTLTATPASLAAGWSDVTVTLKGGTTYTAPNLLHVLTQETTPVISGSSPSRVAIGATGAPAGGLTNALTVTLTGTGFEIDDSVTVNGLPAFSRFVDSGHMQVIFDAAYAQQPGNINFTVISPYTGASNTYPLPVANPAPTIQSTIPAALPVGGATTLLRICGTGFVASSTVQFNGQPLSANYVSVICPTFPEMDATVPASLLQTTGTATLTVTNPAPGGGTSNSYTISISATAPVATVQLNLSATKIPSGQPITLTATVNANAAIPSGQIEFLDGATVLSSETVASNYTAAFTTTSLAPGTHSLTAFYSGDNHYAPATSLAVALTVVFVPTPAVTATANPATITTTQPVQVTTVVSGNTGSPTPTGSVTITAPGYISTAANLANGSASSTIPAGTLSVGSNTVTAVYTPDASSQFVYSNASGNVLVTVAPPAVAAIPAFSVPAGTYTSAQTVTITDTTTGASIYFTTDGSAPTKSSTQYSAPISVSKTETIQAIAVASGYSTSSIATATYTINLPAPSFAVTGTAVTVVSGATTGNTSTITLTPSNGFTGSVALTATVTSSPSGAQYPPTLSFGSTSSVSITGTSAGLATLTITTTAATSSALVYPKRPAVPWYVSGGATLACLLLFGIPARRLNWRTILGMLLLPVALTTGVLACGGGGNGTGGGGGGGRGIAGTTAGAYTITVTGNSGATTETGSVTLTVQ